MGVAFSCHTEVDADSDLIHEFAIDQKYENSSADPTEYFDVFCYDCWTSFQDDEDLPAMTESEDIVSDPMRMKGNYNQQLRAVDAPYMRKRINIIPCFSKQKNLRRRRSIAKHDKLDHINSKKQIKRLGSNKDLCESSDTRFSDPEFSESCIPVVDHTPTRHSEYSQTPVSSPEFSSPQKSETKYSEMLTSGRKPKKDMSESEYSELGILEAEYSVKSGLDIFERQFQEANISLFEEFTLIKDTERCAYISQPFVLKDYIS